MSKPAAPGARRMREMQFVRSIHKPEADRIKRFIVQRDKFLNHTGLIAEGHAGYAFDPDYAFTRPGGSAYSIPSDVMDAIIRVFEEPR